MYSFMGIYTILIKIKVVASSLITLFFLPNVNPPKPKCENTSHPSPRLFTCLKEYCWDLHLQTDSIYEPSINITLYCPRTKVNLCWGNHSVNWSKPIWAISRKYLLWILQMKRLNIPATVVVGLSLVFRTDDLNCTSIQGTAVSVLQFRSVKCIHLALFNWNSLKCNF